MTYKKFSELSEEEVKELLYAEHTGKVIEFNWSSHSPWSEIGEGKSSWISEAYYRVKPKYEGHLYVFGKNGKVVFSCPFTSEDPYVTFTAEETVEVYNYAVVTNDFIGGWPIDGARVVLKYDSLTLDFRGGCLCL